MNTLTHKVIILSFTLNTCINLSACGDQEKASGIREGLTCSYSIMPCPFGEICQEKNNTIECVVEEAGSETEFEAEDQ